jgi:hypothetical protein
MQEQEFLSECIRVLKQARKRESGEIASLAAVISLLRGEFDGTIGIESVDSDAVRERISVVIDALAFHAGEICDKPETIHGVITLLSEVRYALGLNSR